MPDSTKFTANEIVAALMQASPEAQLEVERNLWRNRAMSGPVQTTLPLEDPPDGER